MKKKLLSLILTVVMAGVLAGCAEKAPAGAQSQTTGNGEMETGKMESPEIFRQHKTRTSGPPSRYRCLC